MSYHQSHHPISKSFDLCQLEPFCRTPVHEPWPHRELSNSQTTETVYHPMWSITIRNHWSIHWSIHCLEKEQGGGYLGIQVGRTELVEVTWDEANPVNKKLPSSMNLENISMRIEQQAVVEECWRWKKRKRKKRKEEKRGKTRQIGFPQMKERISRFPSSSSSLPLLPHSLTYSSLASSPIPTDYVVLDFSSILAVLVFLALFVSLPF